MPRLTSSPKRDDVAERDPLRDGPVERDPQHTVVMPVSDQESAPVRLHRVLDSGDHEERRNGGMGNGPSADVGDHCRVVSPVDPVDAVDVAAADVWANHGDEHVGRVADKGDVSWST